MSKMGRIAVTNKDGSFEFRNCPVLPVKDDEMLIEVAICSICGSDIHFSEVSDFYPRAFGHEIAGRVVDIGKNAHNTIKSTERINIGDRVVVYPAAPCGNCYWDTYYGANHTFICTDTKDNRTFEDYPYFIGGFSDYYNVAPGMWLTKIPDDLSWEEAVLVEPLSIAIRAVEKGTSLPAWKNEQTLAFGGTVAVLGSGGVGVLTAAAAKVAGAGKVILVGAPKNALEKALSAGVADVIVDIEEKNNSKERIEYIKSLTKHNIGVDMVFEAAGSPQAFSDALDMVRRLGTVVELGCFVDTGETIPINVASQITQKDVTIFGSWCQAPQTFEKAVLTLQSTRKLIKWKELITTFPLDEIQTAFDLSKGRNKQNIKNAVTGPAYK